MSKTTKISVHSVIWLRFEPGTSTQTCPVLSLTNSKQTDVSTSRRCWPQNKYSLTNTADRTWESRGYFFWFVFRRS